MIRHPPRSPLFPYPTLFRSLQLLQHSRSDVFLPLDDHSSLPYDAFFFSGSFTASKVANSTLKSSPYRSEEHTSELQSRQYLVCRLLLEKKKNNTYTRVASLT